MRNVGLLLLFITCNLSYSFISGATSLDRIQVIAEETVTEQSIDLYLYNKKTNKKIAYLSYHLQDPTTIYLSYIKIYGREHRGQALGKKLFTYFIKHIRKRNRAIKTVVWQALALDPEYLSQKKLEKWYKARGGVKMGPHPNGGSLFNLDLKNFKPERDINSLYELDIKEDTDIRSTTSLELKNTYNKTIAHLTYHLKINNDKQSLVLDKVIIDPSVTQKKEIEKQLRKAIKERMTSRTWLRAYTFKVVTNNLLPKFSI